MVVANHLFLSIYNDHNFEYGENGIRTRGTVCTAHRFSKPAHSATLPSLLTVPAAENRADSALFMLFFPWNVNV